MEVEAGTPLNKKFNIITSTSTVALLHACIINLDTVFRRIGSDNKAICNAVN